MRYVLICVAILLAGLLPVRVMAQPGFDILPIAQETDIDRLVGLLDAHDMSRRAQAATRLQQLGDARGLQTLGAMLKEPEAMTRLAVVRALSTRWPNARVADLLAPLLHDPDTDVRVVTAFSLAGMNDTRAVPLLLDLLADKSPPTRERAISALETLHDPRIVPALLPLLHDADAPVRLAVVRVLTFLYDAHAVDPLIALIADTDPAVSREAVLDVGRLFAFCQDQAMRTRIADALLAATKSPQPALREAALSRLNGLHDPRVMPVLCAALDDPVPAVRLSAIYALGTTQDARAVPALLAHANETNPDAHRAIIASLGQLGDARAADILLDTAKSPQFALRDTAIAQLGFLHDPRIVPALLAALDDPELRVRIDAIRGLGAQQNVQAVPALLAHAHDTLAGVRPAVIASLGQLGDARAADVLLEALGEPDNDKDEGGPFGHAHGSRVRDMAAQYIFDLLPDAPGRITDRLAALLASTDVGVRMNAVNMLAGMGDPRAIEPAIALLKAPGGDAHFHDQPSRPPANGFTTAIAMPQNVSFRNQAAQALLQIDDPRATAALVTVLPDLDENTRNSLMWSSTSRGNPRVLDLAQAMLKQPQAALHSLAMQLAQNFVGSRRKEVYLAALHDESPPVRLLALEELQDIVQDEQHFGEVALPDLTALATDADPAVRAVTISLLGETCRPALRGQLLAAMRDPAAEVRVSAVGALRTLASALPRNDAQVVTALLAAGQDTAPHIRGAAIAALSRYPRDPRVPAILLAATDNPDPEVRNAGIDACLNIDRSGEMALRMLKKVTADEMLQHGWYWKFTQQKDPRVSDALLALAPQAGAALNDQWADVWGNIGNPRAIARLLAMCREKAPVADPARWDCATYSRQPIINSSFDDLRCENALLRLGPAAVEPLLGLLTDEHRVMRALALEGLTQLQDARAFEPLARMACGDDAALRCAAVRGLGELGDVRALAPLLACLHDQEPGVRAEAARALGKLGDTRAVAPLLDALRAPEPDMQYAAATALQQLPDPRAVAPLLALVKDSADAAVRRQAIWALANIHDAGSTSSPQARVTDTLLAALRDPDRQIRNTAMMALGTLRERRAVEPLLAIAKRPRGITDARPTDADGNSVESQQHTAVVALGKIGDPRAIDTLLPLLSAPNTEDWGRPLYDAFSGFADSRVIHALLTTPFEDVAEIFGPSALAHIGPSAIPALLAGLKEANPQTRRWASRALAEIFTTQRTADAHTRDLLLAALPDHDATVCGNVASALLALGEPRAVPVIAGMLADQSAPAYQQVLKAASLATDPRLLHPLLVIAAQADGNDSCRGLALSGLVNIARANPGGLALSGRANIARAHPGIPALAPSVAPLIALACDQHLFYWLRADAAKALGYGHDPRVAPALLPLLQEPQPEVRHAAAQALAALGDQRAIAPLCDWLHEMSSIPDRMDAVKALEQLNTPQVFDILIAALRDPACSYPGYLDKPGSVREQAALSLGALGDKRAVPALIEALDYGYLPGRRRAAEALGMLKDRRAIEPLIAALRHFAGDAAHAPADALKAITGQDFGLDAGRWQAWWDGTGKKG